MYPDTAIEDILQPIATTVIFIVMEAQESATTVQPKCEPRNRRHLHMGERDTQRQEEWKERRDICITATH